MNSSNNINSSSVSNPNVVAQTYTSNNTSIVGSSGGASPFTVPTSINVTNTGVNVTNTSWYQPYGYAYTSPSVLLRKMKVEGLKKIHECVWKVFYLSFQELIALQEGNVKYKWKQVDNDVYIVFDTDADEAQAIMTIGSIPYDM